MPLRLVLLAVVGLLLYAWQLDAAWQFDDYDAIANNEPLRDGATFMDRVSAPEQSPFAGRPVVSFSAAANAELTGMRRWAWRGFNLAVHVFSAWLAMLVLLQLTGKRAFALTAALLWLVHPVCTEPVMYVTQRTTLLMALFYLATIYAALRGGAWSLAAVVFCALGMACKESMVTCPAMVVLIDIAFHRRKRLPLYAGLAATWLILGALMMAGPRSETVGFGRGVSAFDYMTNQCVMIVTYLKLAVWPDPLIFDYGYPHPLAAAVWAPCAVLLGCLIIASLWLWRRDRRLGFAAIAFFMLLAPTSGFVPITSEVGAERRMYLPLLCVIALVVAALFRLRFKPRMVVTAALVGVLSMLTVWRTGDYATQPRLWATVVSARPNNPRGLNNYARLIAPLGRDDEAIAHLQRAVALKGDYAQARFNLGLLLARKGRMDEAVTQLQEAVKLNPADPAYRQVLDAVRGQQRR